MSLRNRSWVPQFVRGFFAQAWRHRANISRVTLYGYGAMALAFVLQVMTARLLGLQDYGVYAANLAVVALAEIPIVVRSGELAMRAMRPDKDPAWPGYGAIANYLVRRDILPFTAAYGVLAVIGWAVGERFGLDPVLIALLALAIPAQIGYGAYKSLFFVQGEMSRLGRTELIYAVSQLAFAILGYFAFGMYGLACAAGLSALLKTLLSRQQSRRFTRHTPGVTAKPRLAAGRDGLYSILRNALSSGISQFDVILLSQAQAPEMVALYKIGKSLTSLPIKVAFPLWRILQPQLMAAVHALDARRERAVALKGAFGFALLMLAFLPPVLLIGEDLIALAYGEAFRGAFVYFLVLMAGVWMFQGIAGWFGTWCVITRSQLYGVVVYAAAFIVLVAGGVAWGTTSALRMAYVASGALLLASLLAYVGLFVKTRARAQGS